MDSKVGRLHLPSPIFSGVYIPRKPPPACPILAPYPPFSAACHRTLPPFSNFGSSPGRALPSSAHQRRRTAAPPPTPPLNPCLPAPPPLHSRPPTGQRRPCPPLPCPLFL